MIIIFLTSFELVSLRFMFLLSGETTVSYLGQFITESSNCNLAELPGSQHVHLTFLAKVNFPTHCIPSFFFFQKLFAHAKTHFVASTCSASMFAIPRNTTWFMEFPQDRHDTVSSGFRGVFRGWLSWTSREAHQVLSPSRTDRTTWPTANE